MNERNKNKNQNPIQYHVELERELKNGSTGIKSRLEIAMEALSPPHLNANVKLSFPGWRMVNSIAVE